MPQWSIVQPDAPDATLLDLARSGDDAAYAALWTRHASAAGRLARQFRGDWDADDLVSEAYTRVLDLVRRGRGPTDAFRPYLFAVVRNVAQAWSKKVADPVDDFDAYADPHTEHDPAIRSLESSLTRRAFEALPERQRAVLWYTEVEGMTPQQISPLLGMTPNSVSALAYRARESLRTEWIQAHLHQAATSADCEWTLSRLGDYTRDHLTARNLQRAEAHLANCASCARARTELKDVGSALAIAILAPVVGMGAGLGYLAGTSAAPAVAGGAGGLVAFGTAAVPTTIGSVGSAALASAAALAIIGAAVVSAVLPPAEAAESAPVAIGDETSSVDPFGDGDRAVGSVRSARRRRRARPPRSCRRLRHQPMPALSRRRRHRSATTIAENSVRPSYAGNGEPGATVTLADAGGLPIASAPVAPDGTWSIPPQYGISPGITGFQLTQTGTSGLTSSPVVLGPYAFRLEPLFSTADQPCGPAQWGVQGWEEAQIGTRVQTPTEDYTLYSSSGPVGTLGGTHSNWTTPMRITYFYVDNPAAPSVSYSVCGG